MNKVYVLYQASVVKKTDESRRRDYEIMKLQHRDYNRTFEEYEKHLKYWGEYYQDYGFQMNAIFEKYEFAEEAVKTNCCDIYEAGTYEYAIIVCLPLDAMYTTAEPIGKVDVFKYVEPDSYIKIDGDIARKIRKAWIGIIEADN